MTSKDKTGASDGAREHHAVRQKSHHAFLSGSRPDTDDLLAGAPFMSDDIRIDARSWCEYMLSNAADLRSYQAMVIVEHADAPGWDECWQLQLEIRAVIGRMVSPTRLHRVLIFAQEMAR